MQGYIRLTASLLRLLHLPAKPVPSKSAGGIDTRLLDWLVAALVNIRREERFFVDVAERYGVRVDISEDGVVRGDRKIEGLKRFEGLFGRLTSVEFEKEREASGKRMPWLEGVVVFWATERVYFEAWSWAKEKAGLVANGNVDVSKDQDGGAMRREFIPNWTNDEFRIFVRGLESILNDAVEELSGEDESIRKEVYERAEGVWKDLLECEAAFWPEVEVLTE